MNSPKKHAEIEAISEIVDLFGYTFTATINASIAGLDYVFFNCGMNAQIPVPFMSCVSLGLVDMIAGHESIYHEERIKRKPDDPLEKIIGRQIKWYPRVAIIGNLIGWAAVGYYQVAPVVEEFLYNNHLYIESFY
ncbi:MAG: hypothetical protein KKG59_03040 [Nanoarchaeota archaeon]|nr:hypothetical protein [Nanoarchaeota archaeon]